MVKLIECPRDAMQGIETFIPTELKASYINSLLQVGFDTIDFGSFVSPKAIPQLRDTAEVLNQLDLSTSKSKLLAIVANERGANDACNFEEISYLGFPFSISETFQQRNTNASIEASLQRVANIQNTCIKHHKTLVVYISMAFGNPYGDEWNGEIAVKWTQKLSGLGIEVIALSDTVGVANPTSIADLFGTIIPEFPELEIGAHFHTTPLTWQEKIETAYQHGCKRFDGAIKGYGGCPMATDELTGNMPTENMIHYFTEKGIELGIEHEKFTEALNQSIEVFPKS